MGWLRQHKESRHVCGIALVVGEPGRFRVRITEAEPRRSHEIPYCYSSLDIAFAAADALSRHRLGGHRCNPACSGWVNPAEPTAETAASAATPGRVAPMEMETHMDETTDAEYARQVRELFRRLAAPTPIGEGSFADWNALRVSRGSTEAKANIGDMALAPR